MSIQFGTTYARHLDYVRLDVGYFGDTTKGFTGDLKVA